MEHFVEFEDVCKYYQTGSVKIAAADHLNFYVDKGEFCIIVGPSGAGKTTLLNILGGMDSCDEGNVWLDGQLIAQHKGGFTPFEADVTALLQPGETALLTVACDNRVNHSTLPVGNEDGQLAFFGSDNAGIPSVEAAKRAAAPQNRPNFDH